jgi:MFS family permease
VALARTASPGIPEHAQFGILALYRVSPLGFVGCIASGLLQSAAYALGPVFAQQNGLGVAEVSGFISAMVLGALVLQLPLGRVSDRVDRRVMLFAVAFATMVAAVAIAFVALELPAALLAAAALFGGLAASIYPVSVAHANDFLRPGDRVAASAGLLFAYSAGASFGPFTASLAMARLGPPGLYLYCAAVALILAGFVVWRTRQRPTVAPSAKGRFAWLTSNTPSAADAAGVVSEDQARSAP